VWGGGRAKEKILILEKYKAQTDEPYTVVQWMGNKDYILLIMLLTFWI
jgi:hypothetical protein